MYHSLAVDVCQSTSDTFELREGSNRQDRVGVVVIAKLLLVRTDSRAYAL